MRKSSWIALGILAALAGLLGYHGLSVPLPPDEEQIRTLLAAGEKAIESRSINSALACVSRDYSDPAGFNRDGLRLQVIEAFRSTEGYDVTLQTADMRLDGDNAEVQTAVTLTALDRSERREVFSGPVTIRLKKESAKRYLLLPVRTWRVVGMTGLPLGGGEQ